VAGSASELRGATEATPIRRLDHVAVLVRDTEAALGYFAGKLGLPLVLTEDLPSAGVRLTYLDCGNAYLQLVEPLSTDSELGRHLEAHGEGMHHVCFAVDDVPEAASSLADGSAEKPRLGSGRGRVSAFVPGPFRHGVRVECTEFRAEDDAWVEGRPSNDSAV
jgi:methylmalonyl-CoA/ethylmalonyl-CoA epimerase